MKVKELVKKLKKCNPEAEVVGDVTDHCYNHKLNVYDKGFAHINKYGAWVQYGEEKSRLEDFPIVQFIFY